MDWWMLAAIIEGLIILVGLSVGFNASILVKKEAYERRSKIMRRLDLAGRMQVEATVIEVIVRRRMQYDVLAEWYSIETGNSYTFHETYWFLRGAFGFRPKISAGDTVYVNVAFRPLMYLIERTW